MDLDFILRANPDYVEDLYRQYLRDQHSVGADWAGCHASHLKLGQPDLDGCIRRGATKTI